MMLAAVLATTAACSSGQPVELNVTTTTHQPKPLVTVAVTTQVTATVTQTPVTSPSITTSTDSPTTTVSVTVPGPVPNSASTSAPGAKPGSEPTPGASTMATSTATEPSSSKPTVVADPVTSLGLVVGYVALIAQVTVTDSLPKTGTTAGVALDALAGQYRALRARPVPAKVDAPSYIGRLYSLELFATAAADEARSGSPQAAARYGVIREQTATLLALVDSGLGAGLTLPPPEPVAPTPTTVLPAPPTS